MPPRKVDFYQNWRQPAPPAPPPPAPRCACGAYAIYGWREPGLAALRQPISQWFCGSCARAAGSTPMPNPANPPQPRTIRAAGASPGEGRSDGQAGFGDCVFNLAKSVNVVTRSGADGYPAPDPDGDVDWDIL